MKYMLGKKILNRVSKKILGSGLNVVFRLLYERRHARLCLEKIDGLKLLIPPEVFNPALFGSSLLLAKYLKQLHLPLGNTALDLGCGSGLLGLVLARAGLEVTATDINPQAVWAANVNAHLNGYDTHYKAYTGSLYAPVAAHHQKFDLIVMNPPYYANAPRTPLEQAFQAGPKLETLSAMLTGSADYLKPGGYVLAVVSSTILLEPILRQIEQTGLVWKIVVRRRYWAEWHLIYELRLKN